MNNKSDKVTEYYKPLTCCECGTVRYANPAHILSCYLCGLRWNCGSCGLRQQVDKKDLEWATDLPDNPMIPVSFNAFDKMISVLAYVEDDPELSAQENLNLKLEMGGLW